MAQAKHMAAGAHPPARRTPKGNNIRSSFISWSGDGCSSSARCSYLVDYFHLQGYLRWSLILLFMMLKAGLIVAVFMHMAWERLALIYAILVPPLLVLVFVAIMVFEVELHALDADHILRSGNLVMIRATSSQRPRERIRQNKDRAE